MRLPSKLYRYNESVFVDMVEILTVLTYPMGVYELYKTVKKKVGSLDRYIAALDCLFLLNKITLDAKAGIINVNRD